MPRCTFKNTTGKVCNLKSDHLQFVLLNDPHDRIVMKKYGCIQHMNIIIDYLMVNQLGRDNLMKALQIQIEKLTEEMHKGTNLSEERQKIRDAKKDGLPEPKMKKTQEYKKEINELWTQWKGHKKIQGLQKIGHKSGGVSEMTNTILNICDYYYYYERINILTS